jgi:type IV pilus biogenesis protein CpaD/CtpE
MVKCVLPLILALLIGCAVAPPTLQTAPPVEVKLPMPELVYCLTPKLTRPVLPVATLALTSRPADTIRAYAASIVLLKGAVRQRDAVIAGCVRPANESQGAGRTQAHASVD